MTERVRAKKSLGQNFLIDPNIQRKIVESLAPTAQDTVVEIGPGLGALTHHLVELVDRLIAIELDDQLAERLQTELGGRDNFTLVHADALEVDFATLGLPASYKAIGNIPYNITTPLIFKLLERGTRPSSIVLMVQKEVAIRVAAPPGDKDYGALSVGVQSIAEAERLFTVGRGSFRPAPNVDSAILRITPFDPPALSAAEEDDLRTLTRTAFGQRRKQLQKILRSAPVYECTPDLLSGVEQEADVTLTDRPENLSPDAFIRLSRALRRHGLPLQEAA